MPRAIAVPLRQAIVERHLQGESLPTIAHSLRLSPITVRKIWRRYRADPASDLTPRYHTPTTPRSHPLFVRAALLLKRRHPTWGAELIRQIIHCKWPHLPLPATSSIQRWFHRAGLQPPRSRLPKSSRKRALRPHEVWQVDAVSQVQLADGKYASWITISDEASGAILWSAVFPLRVWEQVEPRAVADCLREAFTHWGLPGRLRVDNGAPWGGWNDLPRELVLWLLGLGVEVIWNRPYHPQENGVVERDHGVSKAWAEPHTCPGQHELQRRLQWAAMMQREIYPAVKGKSRMEAYPELTHSGRRFEVRKEARLWRVSRVYSWLAKGLRQRQVNKSGQISLYGHRISAGRSNAGKIVQVRFDAKRVEWVIFNEAGVEQARYAAKELSAERIKNFDVEKRRDKTASS